MDQRHEGFLDLAAIPLGWEPLITVAEEREAVEHYRRTVRTRPAGIVAEIDDTFTVWVQAMPKWPPPKPFIQPTRAILSPRRRKNRKRK